MKPKPSHFQPNPDPEPIALNLSRGEGKPKIYNGYTLFWTNEVENRVLLPGESAEDCRKRVMKDCRERWQANQDLRAAFSLEAKKLNASERAARKAQQALVAAQSGDDTAVNNAESSDAVADRNSGDELVECQAASVKLTPPLAPAGGFGCFGIGDKSFGVSKTLVQETDDATKGFVQSLSRQWRQHAGGVCEEKGEAPSGSIRLGCLGMYGFCVQSIASMPLFHKVDKQLVAFVRRHRRDHLEQTGQKQKNLGPNVSISHPLLVARRKFCPKSLLLFACCCLASSKRTDILIFNI